MQIPKYEETVRDQSAPALTTPNLTGAPAEAFGTGIARGIEGIGEKTSAFGETLANHMIERAHQQQTAEVISADNGFRTNLQKDMFSSEVDDNGVPKGVFNRQGFQAQGATEQFDQDFMAKRQAMIDTMDSPYKKQRLGELMDENYPRLRELVAKHEGAQVRIGQSSVVDGHNELATQNAPDYFGDTKGLLKSIGTEAQLKHDNMIANGVEPDKIMAKLNDLSGKIVLSSLRPSLHTNPDAAQGFFDKINEDPNNPLDPSTQGRIQEIIDDSKKRFQTRQKTQLDVHWNEAEADLAGKIANDKLTLDELDGSKSNVSDDFYKIAKVALSNKPGAIGNEEQQSRAAIPLMEDFGHIAEAESDKKTAALMKFRKDVLANSTKLSPDVYRQLLAWSDPNFVNQIQPKVGWLQAAMNYVSQHIQNYTSGNGISAAMTHLINGAANPSVKPEDIPGLARAATLPATLRENPGLVGQPDISNNVIDAKSGIKQVTPNSTTLKPQQQINVAPTFKAGDEREKDGVTYVRGADGLWRPKPKP